MDRRKIHLIDNLILSCMFVAFAIFMTAMLHAQKRYSIPDVKQLNTVSIPKYFTYGQ